MEIGIHVLHVLHVRSKPVLTADAAPDRQPSAAQRVAGAETPRPKPVVKSSCAAATGRLCVKRDMPLTDTAQLGKRISNPPQDRL